MSTTEFLPGAQDKDRVVVRSFLTWRYSRKSVGAALDSLENWARKNDYDAVVGVRITAAPYVRSLGTEMGWICYGTAIKWSAE